MDSDTESDKNYRYKLDTKSRSIKNDAMYMLESLKTFLPLEKRVSFYSRRYLNNRKMTKLNCEKIKMAIRNYQVA